MQPQNSQHWSLFFCKLPAEIRLEIYSHVFYSTRLLFGKRLRTSSTVSSSHRLTDSVNLTCVTLRPAPNSLSLLRVCKRVSGEIGHSWIGQALFSFEGAEAMLEKLAALEPAVLSKLRHMRISGRQPTLLLGGDHKTAQRGWDQMLKVLPGLCLHRLTILGTPSPEDDLPILDQLIKHSDGWRELNYVAHNSDILRLSRHSRWQADVDGSTRPSNFNSALVSRDGPTASVSIYRSIQSAESGFIISRPATREAFTGWPTKPIEIRGVRHNGAVMTLAERKKEVLFVARRGKEVDYAIKPESSLRPNDTREVKVRQGRKRPGISYESAVDTYKHVDDYEWTPLHLTRVEW